MVDQKLGVYSSVALKYTVYGDTDCQFTFYYARGGE